MTEVDKESNRIMRSAFGAGAGRFIGVAVPAGEEGVVKRKAIDNLLRNGFAEGEIRKDVARLKMTDHGRHNFECMLAANEHAPNWWIDIGIDPS